MQAFAARGYPERIDPYRIDTSARDRQLQVGFWLFTAIMLVWAIGVVGLGAAAYLSSFSIGEPATTQQRQQSGLFLILLSMVAVGLPVLAAVVAGATRHLITAILLLVLAAVLTVPALYVGRLGVQQRRAGPTSGPAPTPAVTQCVHRSGSSHDCPGG